MIGYPTNRLPMVSDDQERAQVAVRNLASAGEEISRWNGAEPSIPAYLRR